MDGTGFHLPIKSRVRLRKTVDPAVYGDFACVGNEGLVADQRTDRFGLPQVLIEWDKNHWAYNGVPDCWTFEEHFELVEDNMDKQDKARVYATQFAEAMASLFAEDDKVDPQASPKPAVEDLTGRLLGASSPFLQPEQDPYHEAVEAAKEKLTDSEGFVVIGVSREDGKLSPFAIGVSQTMKAELAVQTHLAGVVARAHQELALQTIQQIDE